jgi:hypothetical protein
MDVQVGAACVFGRCIGVDAVGAALLKKTGVQLFPTTFPPQCNGQCKPLADYEWLALDNQWTSNSSAGSPRMYSTVQTVLKKSTAVAYALPTFMKRYGARFLTGFLRSRMPLARTFVRWK